MTTAAPDQDLVLEAVPIRCSGCSGRIGWALPSKADAKRSKIFCSFECMIEPPITDMEDRNSIWREAVRTGISPARLARLWGVTHPLVYRTVGKG